ncbi:MAG: hypothetical protein ACP5IB_07530 [Thermoplasmata archaeon]
MKETLERIINMEGDVFMESNYGTKNKTYKRTLNIKYGFLDYLKVPKNRDCNFRTKVFDS